MMNIRDEVRKTSFDWSYQQIEEERETALFCQFVEKLFHLDRIDSLQFHSLNPAYYRASLLS